MRNRVAVALVLLLSSTTAFSHTLNVPFFSDNSGVVNQGGTVSSGFASFIGVLNTTASPIVINIVYLQTDPGTGDILVQAPQQYTLDAREGVSWRPMIDDPSEGAGLGVPNGNPSLSSSGSIQIIWSGGDNTNLSVIGRFVQIGPNQAFSHVLETAE
ncbi:MAG: hypothetical protein COA73_08415 [Candidatus Hydrogenedentota bacterium]|nr:MAG: hypothetical protein COA73_08415 [Candidatus Hydrogenedentota bacterium]